MSHINKGRSFMALKTALEQLMKSFSPSGTADIDEDYR